MLLDILQKKLAMPSTLGPSLALPYPQFTSDSSVIAARGMLTTAAVTGTMGFLTTILFLFCTPDLDVLFSFNAPQPFVQIYAMALGKGPSVFMTVVAVIGLTMVNLPTVPLSTPPYPLVVHFHYNRRSLPSHLRRGS
jgi:hypothetical protein